jgi:chromate transport protein ChrA
MFGVVAVLHRLRREAWVSRVVSGLTPAVAVLMVFVAWKVFSGSAGGGQNWQTIVIAVGSFIALIFDTPAPLVLLIAGLLGIFIF